MIIMGQWTRVENNNEVFLRATNHTGQAEKKIYLARLGFEPATFGLLVRFLDMEETVSRYGRN